MRAKVAASAFARGYLNGIVGRVFAALQDDGFFPDPVEREVEGDFLPWLEDEAARHLDAALAARAVVAQIVADATVLRAQQRAAAVAAVDAERAAAEAAAAREAAAAAARAAAELASVKARATYLLRHLAVVDQDAVEQARSELVTQAAGDVEAAWEAERARVGEEKRAQLEAASATLQAEAGDAGEEEDEVDEGAGGVPPVDEAAADVEAEVAAAMDAVARPAPRNVTDADVLGALVEKGVVTAEALVRALAVALAEAEAEAGGGDGGA